MTKKRKTDIKKASMKKKKEKKNLSTQHGRGPAAGGCERKKETEKEAKTRKYMSNNLSL